MGRRVVPRRDPRVLLNPLILKSFRIPQLCTPERVPSSASQSTFASYPPFRDQDKVHCTDTQNRFRRVGRPLTYVCRLLHLDCCSRPISLTLHPVSLSAIRCEHLTRMIHMQLTVCQTLFTLLSLSPFRDDNSFAACPDGKQPARLPNQSIETSYPSPFAARFRKLLDLSIRSAFDDTPDAVGFLLQLVFKRHGAEIAGQVHRAIRSRGAVNSGDSVLSNDLD